MNEIRELVEFARNKEKTEEVIEAINYLVDKSIEEILPTLKDIFFHPLTVHEVRIEVGRIIASAKSMEVYNLLISHLILRNFSDIKSVIYTLGEFENPEVFSTLVREYEDVSFEEQLEIVKALSKIKSVEALDFFSKVYNGENIKGSMNKKQEQQLKRLAGDALQQQVVDI